MPGDEWRKLANYRLLIGYMMMHPGQEADVHGRRVRPVARVARLRRSRLGRAAASASSAAAVLESRAQSSVSRVSGAARAATTRGKDFAGSKRTMHNESVFAFVRQRVPGEGGTHLLIVRSTPRPCRATITSSARRRPGAIANCSTATMSRSAARAIRTQARNRQRTRGLARLPGPHSLHLAAAGDGGVGARLTAVRVIERERRRLSR